MTSYLLKRLLRGVISIILVVLIVMILVYTVMDRTLPLASDPQYSKVANNQKRKFEYQRWEEFGYIDYIPYADYLMDLVKSGEIDVATYEQAVLFGATPHEDSEIVKKYVEKFRQTYEAKGYDFVRLNAVTNSTGRVLDGGTQMMLVVKDKPLISRAWNFFTHLVYADNIHYVKEDIPDRGLTFTLYDPMYQDPNSSEKVFSPAILGNGTKYKYLLYFTDSFPYIHQNLLTIRLGTSYSITRGVDVFDSMTMTQGSQAPVEMTYPTGLRSKSADDLHSATYIAGSLDTGSMIYGQYFVDDYTYTMTLNDGMSRMSYSFIIGILSSILAYILGVPLGVAMARRKDKLIDKLGTIYIVFIIAVPSLAYIFLFKAIGGKLGLPTTFDMLTPTALMYVLPIVSLALPSVASLMKWLRRYMIDQMNSDYVKFARSGGLSESEIFSKHILKNAIIPIVHGIPGTILFSMTGAIITERVYVVPGVGNVLTKAIEKYDNGVIVGVALFYAVLSVVSIILGDILMSMVDPRISFTSKAR